MKGVLIGFFFAAAVFAIGTFLKIDQQDRRIESQQAQIDSLKCECQTARMDSMQVQIKGLRYSLDSIVFNHEIERIARRNGMEEI